MSVKDAISLLSDSVRSFVVRVKEYMFDCLHEACRWTGINYFAKYFRSPEQLITDTVESVGPRGFTVEDLRRFDGNGDKRKPIYLSLKRRVFSVPRHLYGPDSPYSVFAGTDCSRNLGKNMISAEEANADYSTLSPSELLTLQNWYAHFSGKYETVGWLLPDESYFSNGQKFADLR